MQEVVDNILDGGDKDAQYVLNESIETLKQAEYTFDVNYVSYFDDKTVGKALEKLVACSKALSLTFINSIRNFENHVSIRVMKSIVDIQQNDDFFDVIGGTIRDRLLLPYGNIPQLLLGMQDFVLNNLELFVPRNSSGTRLYVVSYFFRKINLKNITNEQFVKIGDMFSWGFEYLENSEFDLLSKIYSYGERPIHYPLIENFMGKSQLCIVRVSACDWFTLMQKYPSRIELLNIRTPKIKRGEMGIEHSVAFIEQFFECKSENGVAIYRPLNVRAMSHFHMLIYRFENIYPFVHILASNAHSYWNVMLINEGCDKYGEDLPKVVDVVLVHLNTRLLMFLENAYKIYENKEEFRNKYIHSLENMVDLRFEMVKFLLDISNGDLPINNRKVYSECIKAILKKPNCVKHISPKYREIMIIHFFNQGKIGTLIRVSAYENMREFDKLILDLIIISNEKSVSGGFCEIANDFELKYASLYEDLKIDYVEYEDLKVDYVVYLDLKNVYVVYEDLKVVYLVDWYYEYWKTAPYDHMIPDYIELNLSEHNLPNGELLAYFYNHSDCKLHIKSIKSALRKNTGSIIQEFSKMVLKLNKIDHQEELRSILVLSILNIGIKCDTSILRAIKRLGGGDECSVLPI